ncbi:MAG: peptidoglycan DD-metalloendopeptidase family protein [Magnetococcus sp. MYC-9]
MKEIKKMGRQNRCGSIIVLFLGCLLGMGWSAPLFAAANPPTKKQTSLADPPQLMYGLKGKGLHGHRVRHGTATHKAGSRLQTGANIKHRAMHKGTGKKKHGTHLYAKQRAHAGVATRSAGKKKQRFANRRHVAQARYGRASGMSTRLKSAQGTGGVFAASVERRMGTFTEPVHGVSANRSSGLFFRVAENANVMAASRGQVVYAGWFRGYGLLAILNHGGRIYSLYGHNRDLLVAKGDFVEPGQVIAKSGKTGSVDGVPGLYFEIRKGNRPENPRRWLVRNTRAHSDKMASLME